MFVPGMDILFAAIGVSIVVRAVRGGSRWRDGRVMGPGRGGYPALPQPAEDPRVPRLQAEVDELRAQVDRLQQAESFYAQLAAPAPPSPTGGAAPTPAAGSAAPPGPRTG